MLTAWDDYFVHQTDDVIERVSDPDELWLESICYVVGSVSAGVHVCTGAVSHPNAGVMAAYALSQRQGIQYNFWPSREINNDRTNTVVGPFSFEILEPMKRWRLKLEKNEHTPVSYDLEFRAVAAPGYFKTTAEEARFGECYSLIFEHLEPAGRITIGKEDFDARGFWANRSRYWGRRSDWRDVGLFLAVLACFKDYKVYLYYQEAMNGNARMTHGTIVTKDGKQIPVVKIVPKFRFEPGTRRLVSPEIEVADADGNLYNIKANPSHTGIRFKASPGRLFHEKYGALHMESDNWDLSNPEKVIAESKWVNHWITEFKNGDDEGTGLLEYAVSKKHQKYGPGL